MRDNLVQSGILEIYRYAPPTLLKDKDLGAMDIDEFLRMLACARYLEEVEESITARAIAEVFAED